MFPRFSLRSRGTRASALLLLTLCVACVEEPAGPRPFGPSADLSVTDACPAADVTVATWDELLAALAAAAPGTTIAVAGTIPLEGDVWIQTAGVTLTCAAPGAGLTVADGADVSVMISPRAPDITVRGLVFDATAATGGAIAVIWDGVGAFGERARILSNRILCGQDECITFLGGLEEFAIASGGTITDNKLEAPNTRFGIHVQGFRDVAVERNGVTTPTPGPSAGISLNLSRDVRLSHNVVRGPWTLGISVFDNVVAAHLTGNRVSGADRSIEAASTDSLQVTGNQIECGPDSCSLLHASTNALFARNVFLAAGPATGIHFQVGMDGTRVLDNRIFTSAPSTSPNFGGIRIRDGVGVVVAGNTVEGPWASGIAADFLAESTIERNQLLNPAGFGLSLALDASAITANRAANAGGGGLRLRFGCFNVLTANVLVGNDPGALFDPPTGANTYEGDPSPVVDLGDFDCDGDGVTDPNLIAARGAPPSAAALPAAVSAMSEARGDLR